MTVRDVAIGDGGKSLSVELLDGGTGQLEAHLLWSQCPSAAGRRRRIDGRHTSVPPGLTITAVHPVGSYGVNVVFSDGHDRGIYPWRYLAELMQRRQVDDFIIA